MEADYGGATHFQLLGLDPKFELDPAEVDRAYWELQKKLHPDRHAQSDSQDRELVEVHAAKVNEAVNTLRSPLLRAGYWMELHGVRVLEEDQRMQDAETMMEVMEVSESIAEAQSQAEIDALAAENAAKAAEAEEAISAALGGEDWSAARRLIERLQMLSRLGQRLNDWSPPPS